MTRKHDSRGSIQRYSRTTAEAVFKGIRVRLDNVTGEVNLRIPYSELSQVLTAAALNCFECISEAQKASDVAQVGQKDETLAYHQGLLNFVKGIELLVDAQGKCGKPRTLDQDPLTRKRSVKQRREAVQQAKKERQLIDGLLDVNRSQKTV